MDTQSHRTIGVVAQDVRYEQGVCLHCHQRINRLKTRHYLGRWRHNETVLSRCADGANHAVPQ